MVLSSCGGGDSPLPPDEIVCTANVAAGISIRVFDAPTGNPAACGATATITAPGFSETDQPIGNGTPACDDGQSILGVFERPGTYTVVVSKPGYQDFRADNVVVNRDVCHVITVRIDARLSP